jgi:hypothetical protein
MKPVRGRVKNGKVVLNDPQALPEGSEVEIRPTRKVSPTTGPRDRWPSACRA